MCGTMTRRFHLTPQLVMPQLLLPERLTSKGQLVYYDKHLIVKLAVLFCCIAIALMSLIIVLILLPLFRGHVNYSFESLIVHATIFVIFIINIIIQEQENTREDKVSSKMNLIYNNKSNDAITNSKPQYKLTQGESAKQNHHNCPKIILRNSLHKIPAVKVMD